MSALARTPPPTDIVAEYGNMTISKALVDTKTAANIMEIYNNIPEFMKTAILCLIKKYNLNISDDSITINELFKRTKETLYPRQEGKMLEPQQQQPVEFIDAGKINKNKKKRGSNSGRTIKPHRNKKRRTLRTLGGHVQFSGAIFGRQPGEPPDSVDFKFMLICLMVYLVIASVVTAFRAI